MDLKNVGQAISYLFRWSGTSVALNAYLYGQFLLLIGAQEEAGGNGSP